MQQCSSGVGTNFVLGGQGVLRGVIMSNKINKARIHTIYNMEPDYWEGQADHWGASAPGLPGSYSTV